MYKDQYLGKIDFDPKLFASSAAMMWDSVKDRGVTDWGQVCESLPWQSKCI